MTIAPGYESAEQLREINSSYADIMDEQSRIIERLTQSEETLKAKVAELEKENAELKEKAWKYDELCK